jgi:hypothetical protein
LQNIYALAKLGGKLIPQHAIRLSLKFGGDVGEEDIPF